MPFEADHSSRHVPANRRLPADFDDMSVGEFIDFIRWWADLSSADRQLLLAAQKQTQH